MFKRRLGIDPHMDDNMTGGASGCPDIWELNDGSIAVIGLRKAALKGVLPPTASCGPDEEIVVIPRQVLVGALKDI